MDSRFNTIAGWALGAGIVLLGATLVTAEVFKHERPEPMGYPIAGVVEEGGEGGGEAEPPIAALLQTADAAAGEQVFRRCGTCHTVNQGGASGIGPNLWGIMGAPIAARPGFSYSEALRSKGGTWTWEAMNEWIRSPRAFADGTRMSFPGLADPQARANLLLYMNQQGGSLQIPPPPAETPAEAAAENAAAPAGNGVAPEVPEPSGAVRDQRSTGGEAATDVTGRQGQEKAH